MIGCYAFSWFAAHIIDYSHACDENVNDNIHTQKQEEKNAKSMNSTNKITEESVDRIGP